MRHSNCLTNMQYLTLVVFGLLVAQSVFQGDGSPTGDNDHEQSSGIENALCCFRGKSKNKPNADMSGPSSATIEEGPRIGIGDDRAINDLERGTEFTAGSSSDALLSAIGRSLSKALGLTDKTAGESVDIADVFANLILALSPRPKNGAINYETAIKFLEMWNGIHEQTIKSLKTVCFLMANIRQQLAEKKFPDINAMLPKATLIFGCNFDREAQTMWISITRKIFKIIDGHCIDDSLEATKIVRDVTHNFADLQGLKDSGVEVVDIVKSVIDRVVNSVERP